MLRARLLTAALAAVATVYGAIALDRISADSLRTNITWLAADQRQGRMTPSPGLEASADYIAAQFKSAGLVPGGSDGTFFQNAGFTQVTQTSAGFHMVVQAGAQPVSITSNNVAVRSLVALDYQDEPVTILPRHPNSAPVQAITGRVVAGDESYATEAALNSLERRKPSLIILTIRDSRPAEDSAALMDADVSRPPVIRIYSRAAKEALTGKEARLTLHLSAPVRHDVTLRNVAGIVRGSDPALREQVVILSAHYDHLGARPPGQGNRVFHGANDNASGAASLIEIAKALMAEPHPKRTILFLALFGEEEGLLGSAYYVRHPLIPIARTVADINLEQLGRIDSSDGPEVATFALTGPSYSNLPPMMSAAAKVAGTTVYRKDGADAYFDRSDNYSFALAGIVAHTVVVAFEFSDYHAVSDEADKLDYGNLAKVDRGIAAGVEAVANALDPPKWSDIPAARAFSRR